MQWWQWVLIGIAAFIVLGIIFSVINRKFVRNYGFSLYGGALLTVLAFGLLALGIFVFKAKGLGFVFMGACALILLVMLIYDIKKCGGGVGAAAFFLQIIFCAAGVFVIFDLMLNKGRSTYRSAMRNERNKRHYRDDRDGRGDRRNGRY